MGKRKSRAKPAPRNRMDKLDTVFSCTFCNHGFSVECRIDVKNFIREASCRICQERFSTTVTGLLLNWQATNNFAHDVKPIVLGLVTTQV